MDYEQIRAGLSQVVPFNRHLGMDVTEVGPGRGVARLPDDPHLLNHIGTQHAAALFAAGEAASGAAVVGAFAEMMGRFTPLARSADVRYLKPARGPITATASVNGEPRDLLSRLDAEGRVEFAVKVSLEDDRGLVVAEMSVSWHLRKNV